MVDAARCMLHAARCLLHGACCILHIAIACYLLCVVCRMLSAATLHVACFICCMVSVAWCLLHSAVPVFRVNRRPRSRLHPDGSPPRSSEPCPSPLPPPPRRPSLHAATMHVALSRVVRRMLHNVARCVSPHRHVACFPLHAAPGTLHMQVRTKRISLQRPLRPSRPRPLLPGSSELCCISLVRMQSCMQRTAATDTMQQTPCNRHHATDTMQRCMQQTPCNAACNRQHAPDTMHHTARCRKHVACIPARERVTLFRAPVILARSGPRLGARPQACASRSRCKAASAASPTTPVTT